jgi:hypothetical protein
MLRVLGSPKATCDGLTRRDLLRVGGLGLAGLGLADLPRAQGARPGSFGTAKRCVLLYLFGAASQLETFDPKPDAPAEVRGEMGTIPTRVPGLRFCEFLPELARVSDRLTVVRSMTHPHPIHASAYSLTSTPFIDIPMQLNAKDSRHWPYIGSVIDHLDERKATKGPRQEVPRNVALPWPLSSRRPHPSRNGGPYGAFLGPAFDPAWTDFTGEAVREASYEFEGKITTIRDPYGGVRPDCRFSFVAGEGGTSDIEIDRLNDRRSLLERLDQARRKQEAKGGSGLDRSQQRAFALLTSTRTAEALDVQREPARVRERYGMTLFGQACLAARRLLEADVRFVTVFWDEFGSVNSAWDTHYQHYPRLKGQLLPGLDRTLSALIEDLGARGMLGETAIACITEHGRTPKVTPANGGGRDHWSRAYASVFAGGGFAGGKVVGRTDRIAGDVVETPVSPKDVLATLYHLLGVDPETTIQDRLGRPVPVAGEGRARPELLG